jgi:hypothetical protein
VLLIPSFGLGLALACQTELGDLYAWIFGIGIVLLLWLRKPEEV